MKIGFVLDDSLDKADGVQQYVLIVGRWLSQQGHEVHYLVSTTTRNDVSNVHSLAKNIAVRFNGNRMSMPLPARRRAIEALLAREKFDILHVQMPYSPLFAHKVILAAPRTTVVVGTFHIVPHKPHVSLAAKGLAIWLTKSLKRFDGVASVSSAAQSFAKAAFGIDSVVLPNVVDVRRFASAEPFADYTALPTVMFLGRLVPRKGCRILLEAIHILSQKSGVPEFRVVICGKGPLEAELKRFVQAHGLSKAVSFKGFVSEEDKSRYLKSAAIAVFPSTGGESFGIVLIEAMAAGALTLGADNVGYHSVLQAKPELLFPINDAKALAAKLQLYLSDSRQLQADANWGKAYVQAFDCTTVGRQIEQFYAKALRQRQNVQ